MCFIYIGFSLFWICNIFSYTQFHIKFVFCIAAIQPLRAISYAIGSYFWEQRHIREEIPMISFFIRDIFDSLYIFIFFTTISFALNGWSIFRDHLATFLMIKPIFCSIFITFSLILTRRAYILKNLDLLLIGVFLTFTSFTIYPVSCANSILDYGSYKECVEENSIFVKKLNFLMNFFTKFACSIIFGLFSISSLISLDFNPFIVLLTISITEILLDITLITSCRLRKSIEGENPNLKGTDVSFYMLSLPRDDELVVIQSEF